MMKTDIIASRKVLNVESGYVPPGVEKLTGLSSASNLTLYAKSSMPRREDMNMKINSMTEKLLISLRVLPIVINRFWNSIQD